MYKKKKEKLFITEILKDPTLTYPSYYILSPEMKQNEMLHSALYALHNLDFSFYEIPKSFEEIFNMFSSGAFPIYKEKYIIGYFGNKMMYLEAYGWKGLPATAEVFKLENWLVC